DPRARAPDRRPRPRPSEGRDVGVSRLRVLPLRHPDRDVPRLQGKERGRPRTPRDPQHPADDDLDLRPPDVEPAHGARAGGRRAGRDLHARLPDPVRAEPVRPAGMNNRTGAHATVWTYLKVALVLTGVTILEVGSIYIRQLTPIIVPLLLVMSAAKFALVVLF